MIFGETSIKSGVSVKLHCPLKIQFELPSWLDVESVERFEFDTNTSNLYVGDYSLCRFLVVVLRDTFLKATQYQETGVYSLWVAIRAAMFLKNTSSL